MVFTVSQISKYIRPTLTRVRLQANTVIFAAYDFTFSEIIFLVAALEKFTVDHL